MTYLGAKGFYVDRIAAPWQPNAPRAAQRRYFDTQVAAEAFAAELNNRRS